MRTLVITGGAGFIGSNLVQHALEHTSDRLVVVDKLTYAGNRANLAPVELDPGLRSLNLTDSVDLAWLEDERRHEWNAEPEAKDVLRRYGYANRSGPAITDGGRIVRRSGRFRATVTPGKDAVIVMRTDAWYSSRLRVLVDGREAGLWTYAFAETAWVEPRFRISGTYLTRARPEFTIVRDEAGADQDAAAGREFSPFRYWIYQ